METSSTPGQTTSDPLSSSGSPHSLASPAPSPQPLPLSVLRLWRPAAKRNLRNQWSKLASERQKWSSLSSSARLHATELVNSYLTQKYMDSMDLGVLSDMPGIRKKACSKLFKQQELLGSRILSSYKEMVAVVVQMVNTCGSMRCFTQGANGSSIIQFSAFSMDNNDTGDGGGTPVVTFWPISKFEELAQELAEMFKMELILKSACSLSDVL